MNHVHGIPTMIIDGGTRRRKPDPHHSIRFKPRTQRTPPAMAANHLPIGYVEALLRPFGTFFTLLEEIGAPIYSGDIGGIGSALYDAAMVKLQALGKGEE
ncbi:hypothetical protein [Solidesulfovibrio sp.]|uniref:hypothetical protein n=1 Tax=Solidesulfovibrio sp. TaxID=2910990 RepID=UPI002B211C47|nr:hypothetical protein [Solidesulfovibrio sp.]MEA4856153.1 hypothetical protein [Solidesulfovibrio sp.]